MFLCNVCKMWKLAEQRLRLACIIIPLNCDVRLMFIYGGCFCFLCVVRSFLTITPYHPSVRVVSFVIITLPHLTMLLVNDHDYLLSSIKEDPGSAAYELFVTVLSVFKSFKHKQRTSLQETLYSPHDPSQNYISFCSKNGSGKLKALCYDRFVLKKRAHRIKSTWWYFLRDSTWILIGKRA